MAAESAASRVQALARSLDRWGPQFPARVAVVCIGVLLLDLGPTTFQNVFRENYGFKQPMYERVLARDPGYTVIERQVLTYDPHRPPDAFFDRNKLGIPSAYNATQTPLGFFHEGAGLSYGYRIEIVKHLHTDLNGGRLSRLSAEGLYLLGVKNVLFRDRYQWFTPSLESSPLFDVADGDLRLQHATPLVFSTRVASLADVPGYPTMDIIRSRRYLEPETFDYSGRYFDALVKPVIETMQVDMSTGTAQTLIARDDSERADLQPASALDAQILSFTSDLKRVDVRYRSNADAVGQLPYNYFPYLSVLVDGRPVHAFRSAFNTVLLRVPKGEHVVSLRGAMPPQQARMLWLGLIILLLVVVVPKQLFRRFEARPSS